MLGRRVSISIAANGSWIRRMLIRTFGWCLTAWLVSCALRSDWWGAAYALILWISAGTLARGSHRSMVHTLLGLGGPREAMVLGMVKPGYERVRHLLERQLSAGMHHGAQVIFIYFVCACKRVCMCVCVRGDPT